MARSALSSTLDLVQQHPEESNQYAGHAGNVIQAMGSAVGEGRMGTALGGLGNLTGGASNMVSAYSNISQGNVAAGLGDAAAGTGNLLAILPSLAEHAPLIGAVAGGAQTIGHGLQAYQSRDKINDPYAANPFWTEAGATTLSAVNTAAALDPSGVSTFAATGAQALVDTAGLASGYVGQKLLGKDTSFTAASALGTAGHVAYDTATTLGSVGMWGASKLASGASWLYNSMPSLTGP